MDVAISEIKMRKYRREDLGDIDDMVASIRKLGLLHPIVLRPDKTLICGERRLAAYQQMGRTHIPAMIADDLTVMQKWLDAQSDENTCRKNPTAAEAVVLGKALEAEAARLAKAAQKAGGGDKKSATAKSGRQKNPTRSTQPKQDDTKRASAMVADTVGMSRTTYEKAKAVMESGNKEAIQHMKKTNKVAPAHKMLNGKAESNGAWKSKNIKREALERLEGLVQQLWEQIDKPSFEVAHTLVRKTAGEIRVWVSNRMKE
jgi:ParB family chromosome partitioning protein